MGRITRWALRHFDVVVAVSPEIRVSIQRHFDQMQVEVIPAFVAPSPNERIEYEASVEAFLNSGRILLVTAYGTQFLRDGREVYGSDTAVEAFVALAAERPELRLALFFAQRPRNRAGRKHIAELSRQLKQAGLSERVLFAFGLPFVPALGHDVIVLRPTRVDGDALSIREALYAGVPVVASDVVERPAGALTYSAEDVDALCAMVSHVLDLSTRSESKEKSKSAEDAAFEFVEGLIRIYREQLSARSPRVTNP